MPKRPDGLTGSVFQRGASWVVKFPLPGGAPYWESFSGPDAKQLAIRKHLELNARHLAGGRITRGTETLADYLAGWFDRKVAAGWKPGSVRSYRLLLDKHILPYLGHLTLRQLDAVAVERWHDALRAAGVRSQASYAHTLLASALKDAVHTKRMLENPCTQVPKPTYRRRRRAAVPEQDRQRFVDAARAHPDGLMWVLIAETGLRIGEAAALRWTDLELDQRRVTTARTMVQATGWQPGPDAKSEHSRRVIPIGPELTAMLRRRRAQQHTDQLAYPGDWPGQDLVFTDRYGAPPDYSTLLRRFRQLSAAAGISPDYTPHSLRHSAARLLRRRGVPLAVVRDILGHASIYITADLYDEANAEDMDVALQHLRRAPDAEQAATSE